MSAFDETFATAAVPQHLEHFGDTVLLTPANGDPPANVSAIVTRVEQEEQDEGDGSVEWQARRTFTVAAATAVARNDRFTFGGDVFRVLRITGNGADATLIDAEAEWIGKARIGSG